MSNRLAAKLLLAALLICCTGPTRAGDDVPSFRIKQQNYFGQHDPKSNTDAFLGVAYAQPPLGPLRWQPPQPIDFTQEKHVTASTFGPACMQGSHIVDWYRNVIDSFGGDSNLFVAPAVGEDCLYLNIWRPANSDPSRHLPVYVYLHGGSNRAGWSYEPNYIGARLAARGVVVVSVAYRLGVFGYFSHPQLEHANYGLLDQIAALRWVKQNIAKLGGDPGNITLGGESSGANNIAHLLASSQARGLFQRAVLQSGAWAIRGTKDKKQVEPLALEMQRVTSTGDLNDLRKLPAPDLLDAAGKVFQNHFFDPVLDGRSQHQTLRSAANLNQLNKVDVLLGSNANESLMYLSSELSVDRWLADNVASEHRAAVSSLLDSSKTGLQRLDQLATAYDYSCPGLQLAALLAKAGGRAWAYYFSHRRGGQQGTKMGAYHGIELPYVFDTHDAWLPTRQQDRELTDTIMSYWSNFIRTGNPNAKGLPEWPQYAKMGDQVLNLSTRIRAETHIDQPLCRYLGAQPEK